MEIQNSAAANNVSFQGHNTKTKQTTVNNTSSVSIKDGNKKLKHTLAALGTLAAAGIGIGVLYKTGRLDKIVKKGGQQAAKTTQKVTQEAQQTAQKTTQKVQQAAQEVQQTAQQVTETAQKAVSQKASKAATESLESLQAKQKELWAQAMQFNGESVPESLSKEMDAISEKIKGLQKTTKQASESAQKIAQETKEAVQKETIKTTKSAKLEIGESKTLSSGTKYTKNADGFTREFADGRVETVHFLKDGTKVVEDAKGFDVTLKDGVASKRYDIPQAPSPKGEQLGKTISTQDGSIIKRFENGFSVEHGGVTKFYEGSNGLEKLTKENLDDYMVQQCAPEIQKMISEYLAKIGR